MKEKSKKAGLKFNIQKTKFMATNPTTSSQVNGEMKQWQILSASAPKLTASSDCNHGIKRYVLLGRKAMTNLDSILKNRDITLPTKVHIFKAMVFPVVMYRCERQTIKKSWVSKNGCFETVVMEKTLESPLDCKESKPVNSKGNQPWIFIESVAVKRKKKAEWVFLSSFPEKNIKRTVSRPSEKAMTPHSNTLAWKIPWMEEAGRLQSMG